jgi:hypothetical protein
VRTIDGVKREIDALALATGFEMLSEPGQLARRGGRA